MKLFKFDTKPYPELNGQTDRQTNGKLQTQHFISSNDMLIVICVKFHHDKTSASLKPTLTKNLNLSGTERRTDSHPNRPKTYAPHTSYGVA